MSNNMKFNNIFTEQDYENLKQGDKIEFKWRGNSSLTYIGRIEIYPTTRDVFFVAEHNYKNDQIKEYCEGMRYYNSLDSFYELTYFKKL